MKQDTLSCSPHADVSIHKFYTDTDKFVLLGHRVCLRDTPEPVGFQTKGLWIQSLKESEKFRCHQRVVASFMCLVSSLSTTGLVQLEAQRRHSLQNFVPKISQALPPKLSAHNPNNNEQVRRDVHPRSHGTNQEAEVHLTRSTETRGQERRRETPVGCALRREPATEQRSSVSRNLSVQQTSSFEKGPRSKPIC